MANSQVAQVIAVARSQVTYREGYAEGGWTNVVRYALEVPGLSGYQGQSWCMTYTSWVAMRAGVPSIFPRGVDCSAGVTWFTSASRWSYFPALGAQVFYGSGGSEHTGIVYAYDATFIWTIEANTNDNGSLEGDGVYLRKRRRSDSVIYGYGLPAYAEGVVTGDPALAGVGGYTYATASSGVGPADLHRAAFMVGNLVAETLTVNGTGTFGRVSVTQNDVNTIGLDVIGASSSAVSIARIRNADGVSVFEIDGAGRIISSVNPGMWRPADQGLLAWTMDPAACTPSGSSLSAGYIYFTKVILRNAATITSLCTVVGTAGSGLTSGQCLAGLYTSSGTRVGITADQSTVWNSAGDKAMALTSSYAAAAGSYYIALLVNGTTSPVFAAGSSLGASFTPGNAHLASGSYRFCRSASGQTALPTSYAMTSATPDANNIWTAAA
ncbi:CHAP domain-containing protein [Streptomyces sp. MBT65]|uniref:CHAP domain-containing protein n=1 Tax=Streptomyces sp. MBT65 TaxID=1488395 RepID=UPI00190D04C7|nr:CHAP domain-containing protein [Streptomyces sp. MBT65]MBK3572578.1 CHAP domain-containing protein [Streptomyces sp. MBT65]